MATEARGENERALFSQEAMNMRYRELDEREIRLEERDKRLADREARAVCAITSPTNARLKQTSASASRWSTVEEGTEKQCPLASRNV